MDDTSENIFKIANARMRSAWTAYHIWKWLNQSINENNPIGIEIVNQNLKIINDHGWFFQQTMISTYKSFVVDLSIFFDKDYGENFSIKRLVNSIESRTIKTELDKLISDIELIKKRHGITLSLIQELRSSCIAHQNLEEKQHKFLYLEIEGFFEGVQEILNLISQYHDGSFTVWDHVPGQINNELEVVFANLVRGERARLDEINKDFEFGRP